MKKTLIFSIFLLSTVYIFAQIKFTASADKIVEQGKTFQIDFTLNNKTRDFTAPDFKNFKILSGPNYSTSENMSIVNGKMTQSLESTFSYYLKAVNIGKFTINPAKVKVNRKIYKSNSLNIEVIKGSKPKNKQNGTSPEDLFLSINLNKNSVFKGEHLLATIKIYTRISLRNLESMEFPNFTGFLSQEIDIPVRISLENETYNDKKYETALLKKTILFPQKSGQIKIEAAEVEVHVREKVGKGYDFFGRLVDRYENVKKTLKSKERTIIVKPLPGNKPDNFSGVVGQNFVMRANLDKNNIKTDEKINIRIKISGNGNIKLLNEIKINIPPAFEKDDLKITEKINNTSAGASGYKNFEYFLLAREPGKYRIAPIEFSYFDIIEKSYKTLKSKEFVIKVEKGEEYNSSGKSDNPSQSEVESIKKDIKYIKQKSSAFVRENESFVGTSIFYSLYGILFLIFLIIVIIRRKQIKENSDLVKVRTKKANKISQRRLKTAGIFLKQNKENEFYKEILTAVWGYLGDKLSVEASNLQREKINDILVIKNIEKELINKLINLLDLCEYAQYAQVGENEKPENIYKKASKIITELEKKI